MKLVICLCSFLFSVVNLTIAQEVHFTVKVTTDTLMMGNPLGIKYTIKNAQGDFESPDFEEFDIVAGPNVSSQFSMINGTVTQSSSYEYYLLPRNVGKFEISSASLINDKETIFSNMVEVIVLDNPNRIRQDAGTYGLTKSVIQKVEPKIMTRTDSLQMKLKKIKAKKI